MAAASLPPSMTAGSANVTWSLALDLCRRVSNPSSHLDAEIEHPPGFFCRRLPPGSAEEIRCKQDEMNSTPPVFPPFKGNTTKGE